jgi:hypothetical protein
LAVAVASINAAAIKLERMNGLLCTLVGFAIYPARIFGRDQFICFSEKRRRIKKTGRITMSGPTGLTYDIFEWPAMIRPDVCYLVLTESRQGTHMTQPGLPLKGNGCHRRWSEMQGQMPAAKQH